ncbi:mycofactocin-coupled SDR family oxidoreductase [Nocardioides sp. cx-173]|uniref:mycofactocin-coupled SDR family oxidoreductase n=1 Tax=Nocardioides sp. cx-173 TaxID=2898796 RepID=UPI001E42AAC2|nr:mycofactocin-coupled SDR family oxidoreductase [Nocardioides sp. cx-173]MCD4524252.1 mycofactocin-coupled SDR family oxidoreductase [Nocardioides sp. cx-173]UGB41644.1 mycofactocin-coupled SDR family oxidoreductase [Nocardioides sp. cx-173]
MTENRLGRVAGKVALITGAARGQGRSHALNLAREGADIIALDVCDTVEPAMQYPMATLADLDETAALVKDLGRRVVTGVVDVRDRTQLFRAVRDAVSELGGLHVVVANAGIVAADKSVPPHTFLSTVSVNYTGVANTIEASFEHLGAGASVIATGSMAAMMSTYPTDNPGFPGIAGYSHSKRGVARLVRDLAVQFAPLGIRVNAVHPGNTETDMLLNDGMFRQFRKELEAPTRAEAEEVYGPMHLLPITSMQPQDISNTVLFLASEESRCITGMQMHVNAGATLPTTKSGAPD